MKTHHFLLASCVVANFSGSALAQTKDWPFPSPSPSASGALGVATQPRAALNSTPPPIGAPMRQLTWETIANRDVTLRGSQALAMNPRAWYHGETENFIIHYRNFSDALQITREIEFDLWEVAKTLGASKEQYARKSHVYVFQDDQEWRAFIKQVNYRESWAHSFAIGDELFLNVHGTGQGFESHTLAHETTHAVVSRIYKKRRWPIWLNEGFAEYMADVCGNVRRGLPPNANPRTLRSASLTLTQLLAVARYPENNSGEVSDLYDTAAKFVRYLYTAYRPELFPQYVDRILNGQEPAAALGEVYGAEFRDLAAFDKKFQSAIR